AADDDLEDRRRGQEDRAPVIGQPHGEYHHGGFPDLDSSLGRARGGANSVRGGRSAPTPHRSCKTEAIRGTGVRGMPSRCYPARILRLSAISFGGVSDRSSTCHWPSRSMRKIASVWANC